MDYSGIVIMYDTHCHLNFKAFADDYRAVLQESLEKGMSLNLVGTEYETSCRAIAIAHEFEDAPVYASVGLHPAHLDKNDDAHAWDYQKYRALGEDIKVVAIGETGIDRFHGAETINKQREVFEAHIALARELKLPLIIHCRPSKNSLDAYENLLAIVKGDQNGVVHCFMGNWEIAEQLLASGLYISFTGIITFKNADARLLEAAKHIPLDRIMIETDAPYLTPEPFRGKKRCEPLDVECVARKIAEIQGRDVNEVIATTQQNGERLFLSSYKA